MAGEQSYLVGSSRIARGQVHMLVMAVRALVT